MILITNCAFVKPFRLFKTLPMVSFFKWKTESDRNIKISISSSEEKDFQTKKQVFHEQEKQKIIVKRPACVH